MQTLLSSFLEQPKSTYPADAFTLTIPGASALHQSTLHYFYMTTLDLRATAIDQKAGIKTVFFKLPDERPCWWRQGEANALMECNPTANDFIDVNLTRLFYAYLMAAVIIDLLQPTPIISCVEDISLLETHWKEGKLSAMEAKSFLIEILSLHHPTLDTPSLEQMLDETKNWVGLLAPAAILVTDIALPFGRCLFIETPLTELTEAQKARFESLEQQAWFVRHDAFHQQLIRFFRPHLTDGKHVIPSQLRHLLPLNRNAYRTTVYACDMRSVLKKIHQFHHSGTVAYLGTTHHEQAVQITRQNLSQLAAISHASQTVMICLNSELADQVVGPIESWVWWNKYTYDDSTILTLTQEASTASLHFAKFCLNGFRHFEWNDYSGIDAIIKVMQPLMNLRQNPHYKAIQAYRAQWTFFGDREVKSLSLLYHFTKLVYDYHNIQKTLASHPPTVSVWFGCASGENRTGIAIYDILIQTLQDFFGNDYPFNKLVARSQHIHFITGNQGNTFGTEGIRQKSSLSFKPTHESQDLITLTADYKQLPAITPNPEHRRHFMLFKQTKRVTQATTPSQTPLPF